MAKKNVVVGVTGLSNSYHDNSVVFVENEKVVFAASEERYSRLKHDRSFPTLALEAGLQQTKTKLNQIAVLAVGYPKRFFLRPFLKQPAALIHILQHWISGRGWKFILDVATILRSEFAQNTVIPSVSKLLGEKKTIYVDHHRAHAASAYYTSGFSNCLTIALDAFGTTTNGEFLAGAAYVCSDATVPTTPVHTIDVSCSIGLFYTAVTMALGFTPGDGEGKTMGFAVYGDETKAYSELKKLAPHFKKGNWLAAPSWPEQFFANRKSFKDIFNTLPVGKALAKVVKKYGGQDVAAAAQRILEEEVIAYVEYLLKMYPSTNLALAGGVFLNVKLNKKLMELPGVKAVFVHPNAGDGGTALGAAALVYADTFGLASTNIMPTADLGSEYSNTDILKTLKKFGKAIKFKLEPNIAATAATRLTKGVVVGWFQGRFEWGPRSLGFRSVLIDPSRMDIKEKLNLTLKNREWFMPFAPSVLDEVGPDYFNDYRYSPFMTLAFDVKKSKLKSIKAAAHIDGTARPNSVTRKNNPKYYKLLQAFQKKTGIGVVLNTSFNKHGLPVINSPHDAVEHLLWSCIEELAIGDYYVTKAE